MSSFTMILMLIAALLVAIVGYLHMLKVQIGKLSTNPNFGVMTRTALELEMETRRFKSGRMAIVGWDVAGMGYANSNHGEQWVNHRIHTAFATLKASIRKSDVLLGQLNSGDEFLMVVPIEDVDGVVTRVTAIFNEYRLCPEGDAIYISHMVYDSNLSFSGPDSNASRVMNLVYGIKAVRKAAK